jgi:hypothetical protein
VAHHIARLLTVFMLVLACGTPSPSPSSSGAPVPSDAVVSSSLESSPTDPITGLVAGLQAAGADVRRTGGIGTEPLGGQGIGLCVAGQEVMAYVFPTPQQREAIAARIDPSDPTHVGSTTIGEWTGKPKFWQAGRIIVLYLGSDSTVEAGLRSVPGQPFARGQGRDPGPGGHSC